MWYCAWPSFVVQINNFFILVLFSAVIYKRRGTKLISKIIKHKSDSSSKMQFSYFHPKDVQKIFLEKYQVCKKSGNDTNSRGRRRGVSSSLCYYDAVCTKTDMWFTPSKGKKILIGKNHFFLSKSNTFALNFWLKW